MAYTIGPEHALAGSGTVVIDSPYGLLCVLSSIPAWLGRRVGHPDFYFDAGHIAVGTYDGYVRAIPLVHSEQLVLGLDDGMTLLGYDLTEPLELTVFELLLVDGGGGGGGAFSDGLYGGGPYG